MLKDFFTMVSKLKTPKEAEKFFKDLLTPSESLMLTRRIAIAKMLLKGFTFDEITKKLKVGANTINNVNRWLFTGFGGYLNELKNKDPGYVKKNISITEWQKIKKKYPAHFMIFNLIDKIKERKK